MSIVRIDGVCSNDSAGPTWAPKTASSKVTLAGDAYLVCVAWNADLAATCVVTDGAGNTYQRIARREFSTMVMESWFTISKSAFAENSILVTGTITQTTVDGSVISFLHYRGVAAQGALRGIAGVDSPASSTSLAGPVTIVPECAIGVTFCQAPTSGVLQSVGAGWSNVSNSGSTTISCCLQDKIASAGTFEASQTRSVAHDTIGMTTVLQMQPGSPVPVTKRRGSRMVSW